MGTEGLALWPIIYDFHVSAPFAPKDKMNRQRNFQRKKNLGKEKRKRRGKKLGWLFACGVLIKMIVAVAYYLVRWQRRPTIGRSTTVVGGGWAITNGSWRRQPVIEGDDRRSKAVADGLRSTIDYRRSKAMADGRRSKAVADSLQPTIGDRWRPVAAIVNDDCRLAAAHRWETMKSSISGNDNDYKLRE